MKYDFDTIVERRHTHSTKWLKFSDPNIIPMWIADMDFACPKEITDPMRERVDQGIFGYTDTPDELTQILKDRIKLRSGWDIDCLLYTSPSPRDRTSSRMPSSA